VGESWIVEAPDEGLRLDKFLAVPERLGSRGRVATALSRGKIFVNGAEMASADASRRVARGDVVRLWMDRPGSARPRRGAFVDGDLRILHEDDDLVVVDKPPGLLAVPLDRREAAPSVIDLLVSHWRSRRGREPLVVHRIDRDTSGLVLFAAHTRAQQHLKGQFRRREPERVYRAVLRGRLEPAAGEWRDRLAWSERALIQRAVRRDDPKGIEAVSTYRVLETFAAATLVEVHLDTGKQNQIRIQAQLRGHPLVGERRYVDEGAGRAVVPFARQALHAYSLAFRHPADDRPVRFEAPLPADFRKLLDRLRGEARNQA
jgi:23S rRNA pseudouridine1911/1915/1917 synthase